VGDLDGSPGVGEGHLGTGTNDLASGRVCGRLSKMPS
jgi:hypothetical protein